MVLEVAGPVDYPGGNGRQGVEERAEHGVELRPPLQVGHVPGALDDRERRVRYPVAHHPRVGDRRELVLAADHDERRYRDTRQHADVVEPFGPAAQRRRRALGRCAAHHVPYVPGHRGQGLDVVRRHHLGQHLVRVRPHALPQQPVCHRVARHPALLRLGGREGVGQHQRPDPLREEPVELQDDLAAHGQSAQHYSVDAQPVEQGGDVPREGGERRLAGQDGGAAVAAQIRGDHAPPGAGERLDLGAPHRAVERVTVYEDQDLTAAPPLAPGPARTFVSALVVVREGDVVQRHGAHVRLLRATSGARPGCSAPYGPACFLDAKWCNISMQY